jgi:hypothetical protein
MMIRATRRRRLVTAADESRAKSRAANEPFSVGPLEAFVFLARLAQSPQVRRDETGRDERSPAESASLDENERLLSKQIWA